MLPLNQERGNIMSKKTINELSLNELKTQLYIEIEMDSKCFIKSRNNSIDPILVTSSYTGQAEIDRQIELRKTITRARTKNMIDGTLTMDEKQ